MDSPNTLRNRLAVLADSPRPSNSNGTSTGPDLIIPALNNPLSSIRSLGPEVPHIVLRDLVDDLLLGGGIVETHLVRFNEPQNRAVGRVLGGDVEGGAHDSAVADDLAGEVCVAPEGAVVDCGCFAKGTHEHALGQLVAGGGEGWVVGDAGGERGGHGDDDGLSGDGALCGGDGVFRVGVADDGAHAGSEGD